MPAAGTQRKIAGKQLADSSTPPNKACPSFLTIPGPSFLILRGNGFNSVQFVGKFAALLPQVTVALHIQPDIRRGVE